MQEAHLRGKGTRIFLLATRRRRATTRMCAILPGLSTVLNQGIVLQNQIGCVIVVQRMFFDEGHLEVLCWKTPGENRLGAGTGTPRNLKCRMMRIGSSPFELDIETGEDDVSTSAAMIENICRKQ